MGKDIAIGVGGLVLLVLAVFLSLNFKIKEQVTVVPVASTTPSTETLYAHKDPAFTVVYPKSFTLKEAYTYTEMGPGKDIAGVQFLVPVELTTGTNLSPDSYVSVEWKNETSCRPSSFLDQASKPYALTDQGVSYMVATSSGAGAGNLYEEQVFTQNCLAVRYFIHSSSIANYEPGTVKEFDRREVTQLFDQIRRSLSQNTQQ